MSGSGWMPLVVGLIAASVALTGYVMTQAANRRQQKAKLFAEAIEAVKAFEELPFRIAKRAASDGPTRAELGNRVSDLFVKLGLYRAWLQIESPLAGEAYVLLLDRTHAEVGPHRKAAWARAVNDSDEDAHLDGIFPIDNKPEMALCLAVMRAEFSGLAVLRRARTSRTIDDFRKNRAHLAISTRAPWFAADPHRAVDAERPEP
jgi:hypothetical protein